MFVPNDNPVEWRDVTALGKLLVDLVQQSQALRTGGTVLGDIDPRSIAHRDRNSDNELATPGLANPASDMVAHVERLLFAVDDQIKAIGRILQFDEPTFFGLAGIARSTFEAASRLWYITDPNVTTCERIVRYLNERLYELDVAASLAGDHEQAKAEQQKKRQNIYAWGKAHQIAREGSYFGGRRKRPTDLARLLYADLAESIGHTELGLLGPLQYSHLSSLAHALPDGVNHFFEQAAPSSHAHMALHPHAMVSIIGPAVEVYETAYQRLGCYLGWDTSPLLPLYCDIGDIRERALVQQLLAGGIP